MKIKSLKKPNKKRKIIMLVCTFLLLAVIAPLTYVYVFNGNFFGWKAQPSQNTDNSSINYGPASPEQQQAGSKAKSSSNNDTPPTTTTIPGSDKKNVQIAITAANQNGSVLQIRTLISGVVDGGTCTLTLAKTGQNTVTKTAKTQALASTSTCQGFNVPVSELAVGTWHSQITYSSATLTGSTSRDIVIK